MNVDGKTAYLLIVLSLLIGSMELKADGGVIVARETKDDRSLTMAVHPGVLRAGPADLGVLIGDIKADRPVLNARVQMMVEPLATDSEGSWVAPCCQIKPIEGWVEADRSGFGNRLFYRSRVMFPEPGKWMAHVRIRVDGEETEWAVPLDVSAANPPMRTYWYLFVFPVVAIGGFVWRKRLVAQRNRLTARNSVA